MAHDVPSAAAQKPVLFVLTSHDVKGSTGEPTGYYLGEVTHPLAVLEAARRSTAWTSAIRSTPATGTTPAFCPPSAAP